MGSRSSLSVRLQLCANGNADRWLDLTEFLDTIGVAGVRGRIVLCEKQGNFRVRIGTQTATTDIEAVPAAVPVTVGSGVTSYVTTVSKTHVDFDPNNASNGQISQGNAWRLGLLYGSTDGLPARGDVLVELTILVQ